VTSRPDSSRGAAGQRAPRPASSPERSGPAPRRPGADRSRPAARPRAARLSTWGSLPQVGPASPVPARMTKVTPRRVIQYIIDDILVGIVPALVWWLVGDRGHGVLHAIGWLIAAVVAVLILIVDTLFLGLVGLITILVSHYRQRVGDHAAKTLVVRSKWQMSETGWASTGAARAPVPGRIP